MERLACMALVAALPACWQSHSQDAADAAPPDEASPDAPDDPPDETVDPPADPAEDPDPCGDGYPGGPYGCRGSIDWDSGRMTATWVGEGDTLEHLCLPNQDDEIVCIGDLFCSPEVDFIVVAINTYW
jgi:hypothetical protein